VFGQGIPQRPLQGADVLRAVGGQQLVDLAPGFAGRADDRRCAPNSRE
jgi:hypothetical protein